jgi:hypothetical protein
MVVTGWLAGLLLAGCAGSPAGESEDELPTLAVTHWTDRTELFMEYPALVAGQPALFAVHLTNLSDFSPISAGRARLEFTPAAGGAPTVLVGPAPSRPGVFRVEGGMPAAGEYRWALTIDSPAVTDRHDLGSVTVHANEDAAAAVEPPADDQAAITYLKEPQWTNEFATAIVQEAELRTSVRACDRTCGPGWRGGRRRAGGRTLQCGGAAVDRCPRRRR